MESFPHYIIENSNKPGHSFPHVDRLKGRKLEMAFFPHLTMEQLAAVAEGQALAAAETRTHLTDCADCRAQVARWRHTVALMRTDKAEHAPAVVVQRAVELLQPRRAAAPSLVQRVLAVLQFDSATMEPALGVRGTGSLVRQLLFNAGPYDVDIRVQPAERGWQVAGQVLGVGQQGNVKLQAANDHAVVAQTELNDLLEFTLAPVASGKYEFVLHVEQTEVVIPEFTLPAPKA
jgi:anti-sigma factor RsiW